MTRVVTLGSHRLALGLDWDYCASKAAVRDARRRLPRWRPYFTLHGGKGSGEIWLGVPQGTDDVPMGTLAGAAFFASCFPDALIAWTLKGGDVWLCVIAGGRPVAGFDRVVNGASAERESRELLQTFGHLQRVGGWPGAGVSLEDAVDRIEREIDETKGVWRDLKNTRVLRRGAEPVVIRTTVLGVLAVGGLIFQLASSDAPREPPVVAEARADDQSAERARENARLGLSRYLARVAEETERVEALASDATLMSEWQEVLRAVSALPVSRGGYRPVRLVCAAGKCKVSWEARGMFPSLEAKTLVTGKPLDPRDLSYSATTELEYDVPVAQRMGEPFNLDPGLFQVRMIDTKRRLPLLNSVNMGVPQPIDVKPDSDVGMPARRLGHWVQLTGQVEGADTVARAQQLFRLLESYPAHLDQIDIALGDGGLVNSVVFRGRYVMAEVQGEEREISVRR